MRFPYMAILQLMFYTLILITISKIAFADVDGLRDDLNEKELKKAKIIKVDTGLETYTAEKISLSSDNTLYSKEKDRFLTPDGQWCFVTINIKQQGDEIVKKEELHCADTKYGITKSQKIEELKKEIELEKARKPGYWELFAEFYYRDSNAPLYCRKYARPQSWFKRPGTVCLNPTGKWEVMKR